jgi:Zn-dependent protease with chaperone function
MIVALALLGYAAVAAWSAPALLIPLTSRGRSVRAGLAAWLAAMASVLAALVLGLAASLRTVAADWPQLTQDLCRSVAGSACTPAVYRSALYESGVAVLAALLTLVTAMALWRCGRRMQRLRRQTRAHAEAARIVGRELAHTSGTVILDDPRPAVYCVAGRPAAIVVTSGALAVLDPAQLGAVLAHERAHLAHRHHVLVALTQGLTAAFPGVPLFSAGRDRVACLTEMAADDVAVRFAGRPAVVEALLTLATAGAGPVLAPATPRSTSLRPTLAAAAFAVPARVERLLLPPRRAASAACAAALALALAGLAAAPPVLMFWLAK